MLEGHRSLLFSERFLLSFSQDTTRSLPSSRSRRRRRRRRRRRCQPPTNPPPPFFLLLAASVLLKTTLLLARATHSAHQLVLSPGIYNTLCFPWAICLGLSVPSLTLLSRVLFLFNSSLLPRPLPSNSRPIHCCCYSLDRPLRRRPAPSLLIRRRPLTSETCPTI